MDKKTLKRLVEQSILDNNVDERFCQLYECIINELNEKKYVIRIAHKLSPYKTPIIMITLKKKQNRPTIFLMVDKNGINLKFVCRIFIDVPLNKLDELIEDCYYNSNYSNLADTYI